MPTKRQRRRKKRRRQRWSARRVKRRRPPVVVPLPLTFEDNYVSSRIRGRILGVAEVG